MKKLIIFLALMVLSFSIEDNSNIDPFKFLGIPDF